MTDQTGVTVQVPTPDQIPVTPEVLRAELLAGVRPLPPRTMGVAEIAGLVLAEDVTAPSDVPGTPTSAMDGFALRSRDLSAEPSRLRVVGSSLAGHPYAGTVRAGEAALVATGAMVPDGADAVVPVEDVGVTDEWVTIRGTVPAGRHVRAPGEDFRSGDPVMAAGTMLGAGQVAVLAGLGIAEVRVHPRPRIAVVPTGDEVRPVDAVLSAGEVHDGTSPALAALIAELGAVPVLHPPAPDRHEGLLSAIREAARGADAVITVGGVSMGERDLVRRLGPGIRAYRVALRPARPFAAGDVDGVPLYGLPGNPASTLAAFEELVRPVILALLGRAPSLRPSVPGVLAEPVSQRPGRMHLMRAVAWIEGSLLMVRPTGAQGSAGLRSLAEANAWAVIPPEATDLPAGSVVEVRLVADPR